ncbi:hypothetical protein BDN70DRAFT_871224 [Pholiota conissans]|uniref:Aminoglycoside phosphotransferase domain-containing protein n=1 Tax=Pholiota conissans TaxID=109636 RepID=A0A9P5ZD79_9AGAR|nr:hypothetical protein BDN70DRAFT_871224 [Pholiota conissans]
MALRQLEFDVEALGEVAAKAGGAMGCNKVEFLAEGSYNRVFRLALSNGKDVVARIPFPNAGPRGLLTRSEVATMDFVRSRLASPIPKVLAWDATTTNDVGCEYIIMELCNGFLLHDRLGEQLTYYRHIADTADLMIGLASIRFSQYGSIYYKEDVDSELQGRPFYAEGEKQDELSDRFRIGPSVERRFYRGERAHMSIDRGPWKDIYSYLQAAVNCELEWIRLYGNSPKAKNQLGSRSSPELHALALQKWLHLAPAVLPSPEYTVPTLSHPDLHAGNIFVNGDDPMRVSGIIDWQGAAVRLLFETGQPKIFEDEGKSHSNLKHVRIMSKDTLRPVMPDNYEELADTEKEEARAEYRLVFPRYAFYKVLRERQDPSLLVDVQRLLHMELLRHAIYCSSHSWSDGLPILNRTLMMICNTYGDGIPIHKDYPICPVFFSEDEKAHVEDEYYTSISTEELLETHVRTSMKRAGIYMLPDGAVGSEQFDDAVKMNKELFASALEGQSEVVQERISSRWPVREGKYVHSMEYCV